MIDIKAGKTIEKYDGGGNEIIYMNIGHECNQKCAFCIIEGSEDKFPHMTTDEVKKNIRGFADNGGKTIMLTGGEPSLRRDLPEIVEYANSIPEIREVCILTNATFLSDEKIGKIAKADERGILSYSVSLHSHIPEISKKLTGGSDNDFKETVRAIKSLAFRNIKTTVYHIITRDNYKELPNFISFIIKEAPNIKHFVLSYPFTQGAAEKNDWIYVSFGDLKEYLLRSLEMIQGSGRSVDISTCGQFPLCVIPKYEPTILAALDFFSGRLMGTLGGKVFHEFEWLDQKWVDTYKNKPTICNECLLDDVCQGFWRKYIDLFGFDGVDVVTKENFAGNLIEVCCLESSSDVEYIKSHLKQNVLNVISITDKVSKERMTEVKQFAISKQYYISFYKDRGPHHENMEDDIINRISDLLAIDRQKIKDIKSGDKSLVTEIVLGTSGNNIINRFDEASVLFKKLEISFVTSVCKYVMNNQDSVVKEIPISDSQSGSIVIGFSNDLRTATIGVANLVHKIKSK